MRTGKRSDLRINVCRILFAMMLFAAWSRSIAQSDTGTISGTITDSSGAVIPNTAIVLTNVSTNAVRTVTSDASGTYMLQAVSAGLYDLSAQGAGFAPFHRRIEVTVGGRVTTNIQLVVTATEQTITVVGEGGAAVNVQSQEVSQVVSSQQVAQLPSLTRNPYDFVTIAGNISSGDKVTSSGATSTTGDQNDTTRGVGFSLNGQRATGTEILLDGVENNDTYLTGPAITSIPIDSVHEYRVITSNFGPEYGRASGGVVNVVTKSGTNAFHGSAWEFNRLSAYTANTVTNAQSGIDKGNYTRNQFGYALGGPIVKNKLFFFQSTEWIRVRGAASNQSLIPTPEFIAASSPATQAFFGAYGTNPPTYASTLSKADVVNGGVNPGGGSFAALPDSFPVLGIVNFQAPANSGGGNPQDTYNLMARVDYNATGKTQMFGRYALYNEIDVPGGLFSSPYAQYNVGEAIKGATYLFSLTHEFSPTLVSNSKFSFTRNSVDQSFNTALQNSPTLYFKSGAVFAGIQAQLPGFFDINEGTGGLPAAGPQNTSQINQDFDWTRGRHSFKFGAQLFYIQNNITYGAYGQAVEGLGSSLPNSLDNFLDGQLVLFKAAVNPQGAFPCFRDYKTGDLSVTPECSVTLPASQPSFSRSNRYKEWAVYAQDAYKASPRLVLNYGLRYDGFGVLYENNPNLQANFFPASGASLFADIRAGQVLTTPNTPNDRPWNPQYGLFSPRVGFAYDIRGDGRTSIRGGYGIAYERNFGNVTFNIIQNPPNYAVVTINNTPVTVDNSGPLAGTSGSVPLPPTSLRAVDPNIRVAQTQFYSLSLEHQVVENTVVSIAYVGSRGVHLYDIKNYNQQGAGNVYLGDPIVAPTSASNGYSRLNNQYSDINDRGSNGDSYYNGVNIGLQMNNLNRKGLSVTANYTYSHSLDDISSTFSESNSASDGVGNLGYLNPFDPGLDYGASDFDVRQRFVLAPIYQTPWFQNDHSLKGILAGGYQIAGIYTLRTGTPFGISDSTNSLNAGAGSGIPRYLPASPILRKNFTRSTSQAGPNVYNLGELPSAVSFSNAAYGGISDFGPYPNGMTRRNAFYGPGAWNLDLAVTKTVPINEHLSVEVRAEGFDILNHHNLYSLESINDVANYGYGTGIPLQAKRGGVNGGANDERRFGQFAARIIF
jgi:hypothetical protein